MHTKKKESDVQNLDNCILEVSNLNVEMQGQLILENVNLQLERGTITAVVGPNGAGKSVLFRALLNLIPYRGQIKWAERTKIGYVPQNFSVNDLPLTVEEFLSFKKRDNLEHSLDSVGLDSKKIMKKSLSILSGGQRQRVFISWAIVDNPDILLFDEPTSAVDLDSEEAIYEMLNKLRLEKKITILLISHDVHIIRDYSEKMLALNKCVTFYGDSTEIMNPDLQETVYGMPVCQLHGGGNT